MAPEVGRVAKSTGRAAEGEGRTDVVPGRGVDGFDDLPAVPRWNTGEEPIHRLLKPRDIGPLVHLGREGTQETVVRPAGVAMEDVTRPGVTFARR